MIDDKELRDLFRTESEEHLQKLSDGLLRLEKGHGDKETLVEVFREAHSLKGAARMVGVGGVEALAHKIEDILGSANRGEAILAPETLDRLYKGLDSVRKLVNEAVAGEPADISISDAIAQITGQVPSPGPVEGGQDGVAAGIPYSVDRGGPAKEGDGSRPVPASVSEFRIETVRVGTRMLDMLMTQAGELTVARTYVARRIPEIEEIEEIAESDGSGLELKAKVRELKAQVSGDSARLDFITGLIEDGIRKIRLVPLSTIFNLYPRMVRDMARKQSKEVDLVIEGGDTAVDKRVAEEMKDPLMHMIRNSIDHGIEKPDERVSSGKARAGTVRLRAFQTSSDIVIEVIDDGRGLDREVIRKEALRLKIVSEEELSAMIPGQEDSLVFTPGFSTSSFVTEVSGRGVGLDIVRANVERLKGTVSVESLPDSGTTFLVRLPVTLATARVLIVASGGRSYALPMEYIETSRTVSTGDIFTVAGRRTITFDGTPVSVSPLTEVLEIRGAGSEEKKQKTSNSRPPASSARREMPCIVVSLRGERLGLLVDSLLGEQEVVLKPQSAILRRVRNISGATVLATGEICMVLNPPDMIRSVRKLEAQAAAERPAEAVRKKSVLLVEDSITTRTQEKRILEGAGYEVAIAVDGLDAMKKLNSRFFDAVVSDIRMPNMDGLTLTSRLREDNRYKELPVILVTSLDSEEDRKRGMEVGASAYIAKPAFDQKMLLEILGRLV